MSIADELRKALLKDGRSAVEIAKLADIHPINLRQFKGGTRSLPITSMEKLATVLGKEISLKNLPKKK